MDNCIFVKLWDNKCQKMDTIHWHHGHHLKQWLSTPRPQTGTGPRINWYWAKQEIFNYFSFIYYHIFYFAGYISVI